MGGSAVLSRSAPRRRTRRHCSRIPNIRFVCGCAAVQGPSVNRVRLDGSVQVFGQKHLSVTGKSFSGERTEKRGLVTFRDAPILLFTSDTLMLINAMNSTAITSCGLSKWDITQGVGKTHSTSSFKIFGLLSIIFFHLSL